MELLKYLKALIYIFIPIFVFNIFISILYYFDVIGNGMIQYIKLFTVAISMLIGGIYIGNKASKKGWLEGMKVGLIVLFLLFLIRYLAFYQGINLKTIIYYFILLISSMLNELRNEYYESITVFLRVLLPHLVSV